MKISFVLGFIQSEMGYGGQTERVFFKRKEDDDLLFFGVGSYSLLFRRAIPLFASHIVLLMTCCITSNYL